MRLKLLLNHNNHCNSRHHSANAKGDHHGPGSVEPLVYFTFKLIFAVHRFWF
jgi:hypothetical protein